MCVYCCFVVITAAAQILHPSLIIKREKMRMINNCVALV